MLKVAVDCQIWCSVSSTIQPKAKREISVQSLRMLIEFLVIEMGYEQWAVEAICREYIEKAVIQRRLQPSIGRSGVWSITPTLEMLSLREESFGWFPIYSEGTLTKRSRRSLNSSARLWVIMFTRCANAREWTRDLGLLSSFCPEWWLKKQPLKDEGKIIQPCNQDGCRHMVTLRFDKKKRIYTGKRTCVKCARADRFKFLD